MRFGGYRWLALTNVNRQSQSVLPFLRMQVWGTDVYTDDSDVVAGMCVRLALKKRVSW